MQACKKCVTLDDGHFLDKMINNYPGKVIYNVSN